MSRLLFSDYGEEQLFLPVKIGIEGAPGIPGIFRDLLRNRTAEAIVLLQATLAQQEAKLGPDDLDTIVTALEGKTSFAEVKPAARWTTRQAIFRFRKDIERAGLPPAPPAELTAKRRAAVSARWTGYRLIIPAGQPRLRSGDSHYPFRPDSSTRAP